MAALAVATALLAPSLGAEIRTSVPEGSYPADKAVFFSSSGSLAFRFGDGDFMPLDGPVELVASPGEERLYEIEVEETSPAGELSRRIFRFTVDKLPPEPPEFLTPGAWYKGSIRVKLRAQDDAKVYAAIVANSDLAPKFSLVPSREILIESPASGSRTYRVLSYAEDAAGNRSALGSAEYVASTEDSVPPAPPRAEDGSTVDVLYPAPEILSVSESGGTARAAIRPVPGYEAYVAVRSSAGSPTRAAFQKLAPDATGVAYVEVRVPFGMRRGFTVFAASGKDGYVSISRAKADFVLDNRTARVILPDPPEPGLARVSASGAMMLSFPDGAVGLFVSVDGRDFQRYETPLFLPPHIATVPVRWYASDGAGGASRVLAKDFAAFATLPPIDMSGARNGLVTSSPVKLRASGPPVIRYELGSGGSAPKPVGRDSPIFTGQLSFPAEAGRSVEYRLRLKGYESDAPGAFETDEESLRFTIDCAPPAPPEAVGVADKSSYESPREISFNAPDGRVFYSIGSPSDPDNFVEYAGPFAAGAEFAERERFLLKAYALDEAGNRSPVVALRFNVDSISLYVAEGGDDAAIGSQDKPLASLEKAFALAAELGRKVVNVKGRVRLQSGIEVSGEVALKGGFDADWEDKPGALAEIDVDTGSRPAFSASAATLSFASVQFVMDGAEAPLLAANQSNVRFVLCSVDASLGSPRLVTVSGGRLGVYGGGFTVAFECAGAVAFECDSAEYAEFSGCELDVSSAQDLVTIAAKDSVLSLGSVRLSCSLGAKKAALLTVTGGFAKAEASWFLGTPAAKLLTAVYASDAALSLYSCHLSPSSRDGSVAVALTGGGLEMEGCEVDPGEGPKPLFFYGLVLEGAEARLAVDRMRVEAAGEAVAFVARGSSVDLLQSTVLVGSAKGRACGMVLDGSFAALRNSILSRSAAAEGSLAIFNGAKSAITATGCLSGGFDPLFPAEAAAFSVVDLKALARAFISERPEDSFQDLDRGDLALKKGSKAVDAGMPVEGAPLSDWTGSPLPSPYGKKRPDIGAMEYR